TAIVVRMHEGGMGAQPAGDDSDAPPDPGVPERHLTDLVAGWSARQRQLAVAGMALAAAVVTWVFRFAQDDAFITYRFSRNFARGNGLVLNVGDRVEGYTNFLWTWFLSIPEKQGWDTPLFSVLVGIGLMVVTIFVADKVARLVFTKDQKLALLATAAL